MAPPKKPRATDRIPLAWRLVLAGLAVAAGLGLWALRWSMTDAGRMRLADWGSPQAGAWATTRLEHAVRKALERAGAAPDSVRMIPAVPQARLPQLEARGVASLEDVTARVTEAVERTGGTVHAARPLPSAHGERLELTVGSRRRPLLLVIAWPRSSASAGGRAGAAPWPAPPASPRAAGGNGVGRVAIVVDDWGYNLGPLAERVLALNAPLTVAILPELPYSLRALAAAREHGKPTLLHLPMEPEIPSELGAGAPAVRVGMPSAEIQAMIFRLLDGLPGVVGVNNHMGSKATCHRPTMDAVMQALGQRRLFFLDSLTAPASVAYAAAREAGLPALRNDLFLDRETADTTVVAGRLRGLIAKAREHGSAIGICHLNEASVSVLERVLPSLAEGDVRAVYLTDLLAEPPQ